MITINQRNSLPSPSSFAEREENETKGQSRSGRPSETFERESILKLLPCRSNQEYCPSSSSRKFESSIRKSNSTDNFTNHHQHYQNCKDEEEFKRRLIKKSTNSVEPLNIRRIRFDSNAKQKSQSAKTPKCNHHHLIDVPFADGIDIEKHSNCSIDDLPSNFTLKLDWPLDVKGFNQNRKVKKLSNHQFPSHPMRNGSLVYYRREEEQKGKSEENKIVSLNEKSESNHLKNKVLFRAECENPCWTTESKRYESSIKIGLGCKGPFIWEILPNHSKNKKYSSWSIINLISNLSYKIHGEDLECLRYSLLDKNGNSFWLYSQNETKIKFESPQKKDFSGIKFDIALFDPWNDDWGSLYINNKPFKSINRIDKSIYNQDQEFLEIAFIVTLFEAAVAIRDENFGAGKRRRDDYGRLLIPKKKGIAKAFSRFVQNN